MKTIVIGNRDVSCQIVADDKSLEMRFLKLPQPCYGQNRGIKNYVNQAEVLQDICMDVDEENVEILYKTIEAIEFSPFLYLNDIKFEIINNRKSIEVMKSWFKMAIDIMEKELKGDEK